MYQVPGIRYENLKVCSTLSGNVTEILSSFQNANGDYITGRRVIYHYEMYVYTRYATPSRPRVPCVLFPTALAAVCTHAGARPRSPELRGARPLLQAGQVLQLSAAAQPLRLPKDHQRQRSRLLPAPTLPPRGAHHPPHYPALDQGVPLSLIHI